MTQTDRLHLRDYIVTADIGAFQSERGQQQRLRFNLTVDLARPVSGAEDRVDRILSYDVMTAAIAAGLADQRYNLLETLAEQIAARVLSHPAAARIEVTIEKLDRVPGALGVTISRDQGQFAARIARHHPAILLLGKDRTLPPHEAPLVILPDLPQLPLPQGGDQRRIALLALDQAAWALAGQLGLDVADSQTEMDWAIANDLAVVWAPFRMTNDETALPADPVQLALWLAVRLDALRLDLALPATTPLPQAPAGFTAPIERLT